MDIFVEHRPDAKWSCPVCEKVVGLYDHTESRTWRHLDSCQLQTFLHARVLRTRCPEHGTHTVKLPWAQARSPSISSGTAERMIIDVIRQATLAGLPLAADKIVFDRFHIMKAMNHAVDKVRLGEHRQLSQAGSDTLKGTKHWWLYSGKISPSVTASDSRV